MKRPVKRNEQLTPHKWCLNTKDYKKAYNICFDEWEEFLPSEEELDDIVDKFFAFCKAPYSKKDLVRAIHKRLMGE